MSEENQFEQLSKEKRRSMLREFWELLKHNKKWWLLPILLILMAIGLLVLLSTSVVAPFIYPLF